MKCHNCEIECAWLVTVRHIDINGMIEAKEWCTACVVDQGNYELESRRDDKEK